MKTFVPQPAFRAFLEQAVAEAKDILELRQYRISFKFVPRVAGYSHIPASEGYTFQIENDAVYMDATVDVSLLAQKKFTEGSLRLLREDLIHELSHILTWPISEAIGEKTNKQEAIDLDENLTQRIAVIASKLLR